MAKKTFTLDDAVWQKKIKNLAKRAKVEEKEFIKDQGGLFVRDIAKFTPPYAKFPTGGGKKVGKGVDKKAGELALKYDLEKIFFVPDKQSAYIWARDTFNGQIYSGNKIIGAGVARNLTDMERHHRRWQSRRTGRTRSLKGPQQMWASRALFRKYYNAEKKKVGEAKAAVVTAAVKIDPSRAKDAPAWVRRHIGNSGSGKLGKIRNNWNAIFRAAAPGLQHVNRFDILSKIKRARLKAMEKRLNFIMKDATKKSGL